MDKTAHFWAWMLLFVSFVWGIEFSLVHQALDSLTPHLFNAVRFFIAVITLQLWCAWRGTRLTLLANSDTLKHGVVLGALLYAGFATQSIGLQYTTASNAGFITGLNCVMVPIIAALWLRQKIRYWVWLGVGSATLGTFFLTGGVSGFGIGELWVLVCALSFALHIVYTGIYTRESDALSLAQIQLITVTVLSAGSAVAVESPALSDAANTLIFDPHWQPWVAILIGGVLGTGLAYVAQTIGQKFLESWRVALIFTTEPLFAAVGGVLLLGESLSALAWIGGLFILAGMLVAELIDSGESDKGDGSGSCEAVAGR
ncbi:DMT family transporter [Marinobacter sp. chi1]|uniref:DMT family transporter n=1 Tax=Marinobacter suaedae TaxID=3057675 RepID=A0ABT8W188_9GAMM|nr:DMT family transporter [Marinobacter sp. chi1]MDO3721913.1 DMT family transporter [Marinobacter sp. chi1]